MSKKNGTAVLENVAEVTPNVGAFTMTNEGTTENVVSSTDIVPTVEGEASVAVSVVANWPDGQQARAAAAMLLASAAISKAEGDEAKILQAKKRGTARCLATGIRPEAAIILAKEAVQAFSDALGEW